MEGITESDRSALKLFTVPGAPVSTGASLTWLPQDTHEHLPCHLLLVPQTSTQCVFFSLRENTLKLRKSTVILASEINPIALEFSGWCSQPIRNLGNTMCNIQEK